jgi:hypothetical protein
VPREQMVTSRCGATNQLSAEPDSAMRENGK